MAQKRKRLSLQDKVEVIKMNENEKISGRELASRFGVGKTQISEILKNKAEILKFWVGNENKSCKRAFPKTKGLVVDSVVYEWFCHAKANDIPVSGPLIREKALEVAKEIGLNDFKASCGWLDRFRARHNISSKKEGNETVILDEEAVTEWKKRLNLICDGYCKNEIYSCDGVELNFPIIDKLGRIDNTIGDNQNRLSGDRITVLLCVNMAGECETPLIVGSDLKPHCLKNINFENINWCENEKAALSKEIMTDWLVDFDKKMNEEQKRALLFLSQSETHPDIKLENVRLEFIPMNISDACLPLKQGVVENFILNYQHKFSKQLLIKNNDVQLNKQDSFSSFNAINVVDAVLCVISSVKRLSMRMIRNCFIKVGFGKSHINYPPTEFEEIFDSIADNSTSDASNTEGSVFYVTEVMSDDDDDDDDVSKTSCEVNVNDTNIEGQNIANIIISSKDDAEYAVRKLRQYFSYLNDSKGIKLVSEIENLLDSSSKKVKLK